MALMEMAGGGLDGKRLTAVITGGSCKKVWPDDVMLG